MYATAPALALGHNTVFRAANYRLPENPELPRNLRGIIKTRWEMTRLENKALDIWFDAMRYHEMANRSYDWAKRMKWKAQKASELETANIHRRKALHLHKQALAHFFAVTHAQPL